MCLKHPTTCLFGIPNINLAKRASSTRSSHDLRNATEDFSKQVRGFDLEEHWGVERGLRECSSSYIMKQQVGSFFEQSDALTPANTLSFTLLHGTDSLCAKPSKILGIKFRNSEFCITLCR